MLPIGTEDGRMQTRTDTISHSVIGEVNSICINSELKLQIQNLAGDQLQGGWLR